MDDTIVPLRHMEIPAVQIEALCSLQDSVGLEQSRTIIERAVDELSDRLCALEKAMFDGETLTVGRIASSLIAVSAQIGLSEFSMVASDLSKCVALCDTTSTVAVAARLVRVGERSLFMAVQFPENAG